MRPHDRHPGRDGGIHTGASVPYGIHISESTVIGSAADPPAWNIRGLGLACHVWTAIIGTRADYAAGHTERTNDPSLAYRTYNWFGKTHLTGSRGEQKKRAVDAAPDVQASPQ
jgi:hypothetical protein